MLREVLLGRLRSAGDALGHLWRLARHPRQSIGDARASAEIFRDLCEGGLVVSTAFPTPEQGAQVGAVSAPGPAAEAEAHAAAAQALRAILAETNERGAAAGEAEPIALRTVLQPDGNVALLIDSGFAASDRRLVAALVQVHVGAVHEALGPLVRAQGVVLALRASLRVAAPAFGLLGGAAAHWISGVIVALATGVVTAAATGGLLFGVRWALETYIRRKARDILK